MTSLKKLSALLIEKILPTNEIETSNRQCKKIGHYGIPSDSDGNSESESEDYISKI